jgi:glycosyltransferase involved in cell wall biosynthesis
VIKVLHLITDLEVGGAESMLEKLVTRMRADQFYNLVVSVTDIGPIGQRLLDAGIPTQCLGLARGSANPMGLLQLCAVIRRFNPNIMQTWLYHADLLGTLASYFARAPHLFWNIRCTEVDFSKYSPMTKWTVAALAQLSRLPNVLIANSQAGQAAHMKFGYQPRRWEIIPNGFDLNKFKPDAATRSAVRADLNLSQDAFLIALPARADPMKDHEGFLRAARQLLDAGQIAQFVLVGRGTDQSNAKITKLISELGLGSVVHALGERPDIHRILAAVDLVVLSSAFGEGFPNVLGEAMACGIPCVSTNVGDAAVIIGKTGRVVPSENVPALAQAMFEVVAMPREVREGLGRLARARIEQNFSIEAIVNRYEDLYASVLMRGPGSSAID